MATNLLFAKAFRTSPHPNSSYITALILSLIITPSLTQSSLIFMIGASILATSSKYLIVFQKRLIFNPAAFGVVIAALLLHQSASWWVGTRFFLPLILAGGFLIINKLRKTYLVLAFFGSLALSLLTVASITHQEVMLALQNSFFDGPALFFACVMLIEPRTSPSKPIHQVFYGAIVGLLYSGLVHFGSFFFTLELGLLVGNFITLLLKRWTIASSKRSATVKV